MAVKTHNQDTPVQHSGESKQGDRQSAEYVEADEAQAQLFQDTSELVSEAVFLSARKQQDQDVGDFEPPALSQDDFETLLALASAQIKRNRPSEAIPYLLVLKRCKPGGRETSRLLAVALMKTGRWAQAELIMDELHRSGTSSKPSSHNPVATFKPGPKLFQKLLARFMG